MSDLQQQQQALADHYAPHNILARLKIAASEVEDETEVSISVFLMKLFFVSYYHLLSLAEVNEFWVIKTYQILCIVDSTGSRISLACTQTLI